MLLNVNSDVCMYRYFDSSCLYLCELNIISVLAANVHLLHSAIYFDLSFQETAALCVSARMTEGGFLSPESTVTSLFASSGHLRSSQHPESPQTIWYKDKTYESASEALDAYIADFQKSQLTSGQSTGQLKIPKTPVTSRLSHSGFKNKDGKLATFWARSYLSSLYGLLLSYCVVKMQCKG